MAIRAQANKHRKNISQEDQE